MVQARPVDPQPSVSRQQRARPLALGTLLGSMCEGVYDHTGRHEPDWPTGQGVNGSSLRREHPIDRRDQGAQPIKVSLDRVPISLLPFELLWP